MKPGNLIYFFISVACSLFLVSACIKDKAPEVDPGNVSLENSGYPLDIAKIVVNKCATAGCHNTQSKGGASGLDLSTWDRMFEGNNSGAVTIAYRADASPMFTFSNIYSDLGDTTQLPKMPVNGTPLTHSETKLLRDWINSGAKDKNGKEKFNQYAGRKKFYVSNQGCDNISVFDAESKLVMRLMNVGNNPGLIETPHMLRISPDGNYLYAVFQDGNAVQKFSTANDSLIGEAIINGGIWSTMAISQDGSTGYVSDWNANGRIACIDLNSMSLKMMYSGANLLENPHGLALLETGSSSTLYVTAQYGNFIYKIDVTNPMNPDVSLPMSLQPGFAVTSSNLSLNPHEVSIAPGDSVYFVTCEHKNEVRAYRVINDAFIDSFPGFNDCKEMAYSVTNKLLFVSCLNDSLTFPQPQRGAIGVIDLQTMTVVKMINTGFQPHGLAVDDLQNKVYVANINGIGPAPHHKSLCTGRNGNVTIINMSTLEIIPGYKHEVSVFPYSVTLRN